jgi:7-keto-8-aminopelargonate synthetase-like enzyme
MHTNHGLAVIAPAAARRRATGRWALIEHLRRMHENTALFVRLAHEAGIVVGDGAGGPMIPCIVASSTEAVHLREVLTRRGVNADAMPSRAAKEQARLSFFVTSCHSEEQIRFMVTVLAEELELLNATRRAD